MPSCLYTWPSARSSTLLLTMMPSAPSSSCLQMKTTLFWKRSSGIDGAATRKRPTRVAAGVLDPGMFKVSSKSMGIVRARIKGTKTLCAGSACAFSANEIASASIRPKTALGSARLTATSEDRINGQGWRQGPQRNAEDDGPGGSQTNDDGGAVRSRQEGGRLRPAGCIHPHLKRQACARFSGQH